MKKVLFYVLPFVFFGCSATVDPQISMKPPAYVEELAPKQSNNVESAPGSLLAKEIILYFQIKKL